MSRLAVPLLVDRYIYIWTELIYHFPLLPGFVTLSYYLQAVTSYLANKHENHMYFVIISARNQISIYTNHYLNADLFVFTLPVQVCAK